jgi:hypothetical protein
MKSMSSMHESLRVSDAVNTLNAHGNPAFAALIWWLVPLFAVTGAIIYVIWVSRFKDKYESETNRSVSAFQAFQRSFEEPASREVKVRELPESGEEEPAS